MEMVNGFIKNCTFTLLIPILKTMGMIIAAVYSCIEISNYFGINLIQLKSNWKHFITLLLISFIISVAYVWLKCFFFRCKVEGKSACIILRVGDILKTRGDILVPCNNIFDIRGSHKLCKRESVLGAFVYRYYRDNVEELRNMIATQLKRRKKKEPLLIDGEEIDYYNYGTVVTVPKRKDKAYIVATNEVREEFRDSNPVEEVFRNFWKNKNDKDGASSKIAVPLVGTGTAGFMDLDKDMVVMKIVESYLKFAFFDGKAATNRLEIVITPSDLEFVNLKKLRDYITFECEFAERNYGQKSQNS